MIQSALVASICLVAALAIRGHYLADSQRWQIYVFKPLATLLVLALALAFPAATPAAYRWAVTGGILFSVAGDVLLMLPRDRFVAGLLSFLVAHLFYIFAFSTDVAFGAGQALWIPFFIAGGVVIALVWPGLKSALRAPVAAYVIVIATMAGQAAGRWQVLGTEAALAGALGAGLFVVSDSILALDRFRTHFKAARALTLASYWMAQTLIALSIAAGRLPG